MAADYITEEGWHTVEDGEKLYTKTWKPAGETKARIVFVHGFSDHCNAYGPLFPGLASRGIEVFGFDQRGWGRTIKSPKDKGASGPTSRVLDDISSILRRFIPSGSEAQLDLPLFLMGHSMGGAEVIHHATSQKPEHAEPHKYISGLLLEAPYIALNPKSQPWAITEFAGRIASKVAPKMHMKADLNPDFLSRDKAVCERLHEDELCHDTGTLEGLEGMLDRGASINKGRVTMTDLETSTTKKKRAIWVSHGTGDRICEWVSTKKWFDTHCKVEDRTFKAYDGWYHRLHEEPGEDVKVFQDDVTSWIIARL